MKVENVFYLLKWLNVNEVIEVLQYPEKFKNSKKLTSKNLIN